MRSLFFFYCTSFAISTSFAQEINNYSTLFDVRDSSYTRISYDNDLFVGTDRFYTQGIGIDVFSYNLRRNPLNKLLFRLRNSDRDRFGIEFRTHGCTPTTILSDSVLVGDRPFAGVFSVGIVRSSHQVERRLRLVSKFELGMIGPAALGEEIQTGIHRLTGDDLPLGWQHQIKNSPIINYSTRLELGTGLFVPRYFYSSVFGQAKIGTFQTNLSAGVEFSVGPKNTSYSERKHRYELYAYSRSEATLVGYDASLMGGIVNRYGYYLPYSEINPFVFRQHVGVVFGAPHFSLAFNLAFTSREIKAGIPHSWGGVQLTFY
ncbi:MAG: lipid A deacylase LpxR family protein [Crocinitomicaceae bacterium]|nr:lipid A deacylase LpxR family protein [Crocinitomicaceae bacterium]